MEEIDLFDKYIKGELSEKERHEFDARLKDDQSLADDFKVYSATVIGICKEAEQDNKDFEVAMKHISKEQLREIIGKKNDNRAEIPIAASKVVKTIKPNFFRPWMWQISSFAAIIIIAVISVLKVQRDARYAVDDALVASADLYVPASKSGETSIDVRNLSDSQLKEKLPSIIELYKNSTELEEVADNGFILVMTYIRLHDRKNAASTLNEIISKLKPYGYQDDISKWETILNVIE